MAPIANETEMQGVPPTWEKKSGENPDFVEEGEKVETGYMSSNNAMPSKPVQTFVWVLLNIALAPIWIFLILCRIVVAMPCCHALHHCVQLADCLNWIIQKVLYCAIGFINC
jgi:hypothetical protein